MNTKKFKMDLLNPEEMKNVNGGAKFECNKKGDTVMKGMGTEIVVCATMELSCQPKVSTKCGYLGVSISGCQTVSLGPMSASAN